MLYSGNNISSTKHDIYWDTVIFIACHTSSDIAVFFYIMFVFVVYFLFVFFLLYFHKVIANLSDDIKKCRNVFLVKQEFHGGTRISWWNKNFMVKQEFHGGTRISW